jgi:hypothetical protein
MSPKDSNRDLVPEVAVQAAVCLQLAYTTFEDFGDVLLDQANELALEDEEERDA